ncbi:hypothetical protein J6TS7_02800 [Paenibacillus dendritiformis]|uniref:baseplate J/gp47 family protein n=1 Tax=Paenibacillus TaxID=44249 RepID=UPI001B0B0F9C|nr:baseplate J/gp47 family protein [Paenibacillus dendritiformis]GIO76670.1 hypothetical protein J6TS7_02800 [Paenibacillus dendritiformis]
MIEEKALDQLLPVPDREETKNKLREGLEQEGFVITNLFTGGVFYTLMMIAIQVRIDLVQLLRKVLNNQFVTHAESGWLELKAADFSKRRKQPVKTRGFVTLKRKVAGKAVKISKGDVFRTEPDMLGEELRFIVLENSTMPADALSHHVAVEAEKAGSTYNVPPGQIRRSLTHIESIDEITNDADWITREGSDLEDLESLRERTLNSWAELSTMPIAAKYKNVCEAIPGVLYVRVDDLHPRGQGTIDIIVTGTAGTPSEGLLQKVREEADKIKGPDDNLLVKASDTVTQDIDITIWIASDASDEGIEEHAKAILTELLRIKKGRNLNELNHSDIIFAIRKELAVRNVKVINPPQDVVLDNSKVIVLGEVTVRLMRG